MGDESGLLLVMKRGRKLNFNQASEEKAARVYPTYVEVGGMAQPSQKFGGFPYELAAS